MCVCGTVPCARKQKILGNKVPNTVYGGEDAIEHWTLPSDIIQARDRKRGAEWVKPTMTEAFYKICFMVSVLYV